MSIDYEVIKVKIVSRDDVCYYVLVSLKAPALTMGRPESRPPRCRPDVAAKSEKSAEIFFLELVFG